MGIEFCKLFNSIGCITSCPIVLYMCKYEFSEKFPFSKDLMKPESIPFAYYSFNNGFGFIKPGKKIAVDNKSGSPLFKEGPLTNTDLEEGKAYLQYSFQDYLNK